MNERRMARQQTWEIQTDVNNRRPLSAHTYQCQLKACTGAGAQMNTAKCEGMQTPDRCTGPSASQDTAVL